MPGRKHLIAVNRAIKAGDLDEKGLDAPTIELARDLARQMDACDGPAPVRLQGNYLSATKDLARAARASRDARARATLAANRAAAAAARTGQAEPDGPPELKLVNPPKTALEKFRDQHLPHAGTG
ncbi:hypothetical protein M3D75_02870 [Microbacterium enclense]|uniref:hypothetical protein n=1 Tax=Microbacterium enclense TaxID=993073 RepID=UPI0021A427BB|nr:hypothetical protein [Microbacterium enclense]MCT2085050.1 hypothetical protein [Microbacterium enclense]